MPFYATPPAMVTFTSVSAPGFTSFAWDFGDGTTSAAENPTHEYLTAGDFTVTLTAYNNAGKTQAFSDVVHIGTDDQGYVAPDPPVRICGGLDAWNRWHRKRALNPAHNVPPASGGWTPVKPV